MAELGYSLEAQDVLERMGVHNARELLAVDRVRFRYLKGVGDKIRKEIRLTAKELARLRPDLTQGRSLAHDADEDIEGAVSINELAAQLLPRRPAGDDRPEEAALAHYLGLDDAVPAGAWPSLGDAAQAGEVDRATLTATLIKARERWLKNPAFTELRHQLDTLVSSQGNVMSAREGALALLALRGCASQDDAERLRQATAVLRGAVEAEAHLDQPRFEAYDHQPHMLIASAGPWADYARQLGAAADACALADPLLPPARVLEMLEGVPLPRPDQLGGTAPAPIPPTRLLRLAASASRKAAVSSRQEMYMRGMAPIQALRQSLGALVGASELRAKDIQDRVRGRYPEASALPGRPGLDRLLEEAGAPLSWDITAADGRGAYRLATLGRGQTAGTTTHFSRQATLLTPHVAGDSDAAQAAVVEERLVRSLDQGGLLVLTVPPRIARRAEAELIRRFGHPTALPSAVQRLNLDALLLATLREQAQAMRIDWKVVLEADAEPGGYCKTVVADGFVWDYSGHFFHFADPSIEAWLRARLAGHALHTVARRAQIRFAGRDIDYPFQKHIHQLPLDDFLTCLVDLFEAARQPAVAPTSFADMLARRFGAGIVDRFLRPYNEKLYATPLERLDVDAMGRFFPRADLADIIANLRPGARGDGGYNATFLYPAGGAIEIVRALVRGLPAGAVRCATPALAIDRARRQVITPAGPIAYERVVSSAICRPRAAASSCRTCPTGPVGTSTSSST